MRRIYGIDLGTTSTLISLDGEILGDKVHSEGKVNGKYYESFKTLMSENDVDIVECATQTLERVIKQSGKTDVTDVIICIPADFSPTQVAGTKIAAQRLGLDVVQIIAEPVAAFAPLAHSLGKGIIFDLGGGTFDLALLEKDKSGIIQIIDTDGNAFIGGYDLDVLLFKRIAMQQKLNLLDSVIEDYQKELFSFMREVKMKMQRGIEQEGMSFSGAFKSKHIPCFSDKVYLDAPTYAACVRQVFGETVKSLKRLIERNKEVISGTTLIKVGGSTLCPIVGQMIKEVVEPYNIRVMQKDPEMLVAQGAGIIAAAVNEGKDSYRTEMSKGVRVYQNDIDEDNFIATLVLDGAVLPVKQEIHCSLFGEFPDIGATARLVLLIGNDRILPIDIELPDGSLELLKKRLQLSMRYETSREMKLSIFDYKNNVLSQLTIFI